MTCCASGDDRKDESKKLKDDIGGALTQGGPTDEN